MVAMSRSSPGAGGANATMVTLSARMRPATYRPGTANVAGPSPLSVGEPGTERGAEDRHKPAGAKTKSRAAAVGCARIQPDNRTRKRLHTTGQTKGDRSTGNSRD